MWVRALHVRKKARINSENIYDDVYNIKNVQIEKKSFIYQNSKLYVRQNASVLARACTPFVTLQSFAHSFVKITKYIKVKIYQ
jgi:acetyltransferase-like isoleucine patch superfamily enzyme